MEAALLLPHKTLSRPLGFSSSFSPICAVTCYRDSSSPLCPSHLAKHPLISLKPRRLRGLTPLCLSASVDGLSPHNTERWLLLPVGDGDTRHIGFKVPMPAAFEISSSVVNVGRVPEKADVVIPVATVSALHARIEKKEGRLLVTDLDSTNGTFINEKRLRPGAPAAVLPGNKITFGDTHLAIFLVSKLENVNLPSKPDESAASDKYNPKIVIEEES